MQTPNILQNILLKKNNRFLVLLISLVIYFASFPIVENLTIAKHLLSFFYLLIIFSAVFSISDTKKPLFISSSFLLLTLTFRWLHYFYQLDTFYLLELSSTCLFWSYVASYILRFIINQQYITAELVYAAIAVYFIIGLIWTSAYQIIELNTPHAFSIVNEVATQKQELFFQMWYFSMVTLTTLGYGDITPITMTARSFVILEAMTGQFYLAILIASLIGRRVAQKN